MGETQGAIFTVLALALLLLGVIGLLRIGALRLESNLGRLRDGLRVGKEAPRWRLRDLSGLYQQVPAGHLWQLLLFADYSLLEFPEVPPAVRALCRDNGIEGMLVCKSNLEVTSKVAEILEFGLPIVSVDDDFYWTHNVRVMPFVFFIDPDGIVRGSGIVNDEETLRGIWEFAQLEGRAASRISSSVSS
jgi:hypothetical protein